MVIAGFLGRRDPGWVCIWGARVSAASGSCWLCHLSGVGVPGITAEPGQNVTAAPTWAPSVPEVLLSSELGGSLSPART